ncbi:hypothetical protein [Streptomyces sp. NBC_00842]|uniref:hypothetical protein n=1 Tax=Streptomyces sp. NBC_00842 TaxID=2975848 RepID=UPI002F9184D0|nr:hypothetical protein OH821_45370 [Streptomyces sp. NBC_00842]
MSRKTSTKQRPARPAPKKPQLPAVRAVLPVRPHTDTPPTLYPEFITEAQITAAYAARLADLPLIPITAWQPNPDGTVRAHFPTGASLTHTPDGFDALTPCPNGAHHHHRITTGTELRHAAAAAAHCTQLHGWPRTLTLAQAATTTADTQQLNRDDIDTGLANRTAADEKPKEHPEP